jgi:hypothetical protein
MHRQLRMYGARKPFHPKPRRALRPESGARRNELQSRLQSVRPSPGAARPHGRRQQRSARTHLRPRQRVRGRARGDRHHRPCRARVAGARRSAAAATAAAAAAAAAARPRGQQVAVQPGSFLEGDKGVADRRHVARGGCRCGAPSWRWRQEGGCRESDTGYVAVPAIELPLTYGLAYM